MKIKLSELARICDENDNNCFNCSCKDSCKNMVDYVEDATPVAIIEMVKEDKEF